MQEGKLAQQVLAKDNKSKKEKKDEYEQGTRTTVKVGGNHTHAALVARKRF